MNEHFDSGRQWILKSAGEGGHAGEAGTADISTQLQKEPPVCAAKPFAVDRSFLTNPRLQSLRRDFCAPCFPSVVRCSSGYLPRPPWDLPG